MIKITHNVAFNSRTHFRFPLRTSVIPHHDPRLIVRYCPTQTFLFLHLPASKSNMAADARVLVVKTTLTATGSYLPGNKVRGKSEESSFLTRRLTNGEPSRRVM